MRLPGAVLLVAALAACRRPAPRGFTLLFFRASSTAQGGRLTWAPDLPGGRVVGFDRHLKPNRVLTYGVEQPVAVAYFSCRASLAVSEYSGDVVMVDTADNPAGEFMTQFPATVVASSGCRGVQGRSPYMIQAFSADTVSAPLITYDHMGHPSLVGTLHQSTLPFLVDAENAGAVAVDSLGAIYYAPMARDEIQKYSSAGVLEWTTKRGLYRTEEEPRFLPNQGRVVPLLVARAGIALTLGPDGRLYALGADDSTASRMRVDVLDTATGTLLTTRHLGPHETAVALDERDSLQTFEADSLLAGLKSSPREAFGPPFVLQDLKGFTVRTSDYVGKVTLVNFWASWCDPCREEFPHMADLYGQFSRKDFDIAAISDDVDPGKMRAFVTAFRPPFPILVGGGRMKAAYHYRGLPYSVLLDRHGRIVKRIFGFGGAPEFQELAATIAKEIAAP